MGSVIERVLNSAKRRLFGTIVSVRTPEKFLALTFDDGPDPVYTPAILEALARHNAKATFFMVGSRAQRHPDIVANVAAEGHEIGNHSWDHESLPLLSTRDVRIQINRTRNALGPVAGPLIRPPYGHQTLRTFLISRTLGYQVVGWTAHGSDWSGSGAPLIAQMLLQKSQPGSIILLHDSLCTYADERFRDRRPTIEAVNTLLGTLQDYRFVTVSELLGKGPLVKRYRVVKPKLQIIQQLKSATHDEY